MKLKICNTWVSIQVPVQAKIGSSYLFKATFAPHISMTFRI